MRLGGPAGNNASSAVKPGKLAISDILLRCWYLPSLTCWERVAGAIPAIFGPAAIARTDRKSNPLAVPLTTGPHAAGPSGLFGGAYLVPPIHQPSFCGKAVTYRTDLYTSAPWFRK